MLTPTISMWKHAFLMLSKYKISKAYFHNVPYVVVLAGKANTRHLFWLFLQFKFQVFRFCNVEGMFSCSLVNYFKEKVVKIMFPKIYITNYVQNIRKNTSWVQKLFSMRGIRYPIIVDYVWRVTTNVNVTPLTVCSGSCNNELKESCNQ